jgi:hypothetical protein
MFFTISARTVSGMVTTIAVSTTACQSSTDILASVRSRRMPTLLIKKINSAPAGLRVLHHALYGGRVGHIRGRHVGTVGAGRVQLRGQLLRVRARGADIGMVQDHARTRAVEAPGQLGANALGCAGDQGDLSRKIQGDAHALPR